MSSEAELEANFQAAKARADLALQELQELRRVPDAPAADLRAAELRYVEAANAQDAADWTNPANGLGPVRPSAARSPVRVGHRSAAFRKEHPLNSLAGAEADYRRAQEKVERAANRIEALPDNASASLIDSRTADLNAAIAAADEAEAEVIRARGGSTSIRVSEPDIYTRDRGNFIHDLYQSQLRGDPLAAERITRHQAYEVEKRAISTGTLGGIVPPQYLVGLYAKAPRNGRVYIDQMNGDEPLMDTGQTLVVPRLTEGTAAGVQSSESSTLTTQDVTETDLDVPVRTVGGYVPVSRQTLERASYSEAILFEDLIARYYAALDVDCLSGSGSSGHILGLFNTSGLVTPATQPGSQTLASVWPKIADVIQQINANIGGLGYVADKIFMHPRRWGWFESQLDSAGRPVFGINGMPNYAPLAEGDAAGYGLVGRMHGLPVFIDANIPTTLGTSTNEDAIIVCASRIVHLWESPEAPFTLRFEEQAGTALQVQLIAYGYAAFTAGRYPGATGTIYGAGTVPPTFGS